MESGVHQKHAVAVDPGEKRSDESKDGCKISNRQRRSKSTAVQDSAEIIEVIFDATKKIKNHALDWALRNITLQSGDLIVLLAVIAKTNKGWYNWRFTMLNVDCTKRKLEAWADIKQNTRNACKQVLGDVKKLCKEKKVYTRLKVIRPEMKGFAAMEATKMKATWVVLDRRLKEEGKYCLERLQCNVVLVDRAEAKIIRLMLKSSLHVEIKDSLSPREGKHGDAEMSTSKRRTFCNSDELPITTTSSPSEFFSSSTLDDETDPSLRSTNMSHDSMEEDTSLENSERVAPFTCFKESYRHSVLNKKGDISSFIESQKFLCSEKASRNRLPNSKSEIFAEKGKLWLKDYSKRPSMDLGRSLPFFKTEKARNASTFGSVVSMPYLPAENYKVSRKSKLSDLRKFSHEVKFFSSNFITNGMKDSGKMPSESNSASLSVKKHEIAPDKFSLLEWTPEARSDLEKERLKQENLENSTSLRVAMSLFRHVPPGPPPLCSLCQLKSPKFGRPPQRFFYNELQAATDGFSNENFLAEGGFGSVHRGILQDGPTVAVKQHKLASSQGDSEFCSEVEVLSCAQHRNVVTLIGYCIEDHRRLLVYEFVCNGSLDSHLSGKKRPLLEWNARQKIAVGAARGLRYLHEESRVGCIIHRDMRPNNILLTHDFEPMVGDFGLARWQPDGDFGVETRVLGTFGYLAPEYAQSGQITDKADVYSFGVVLLEIATGHKAIDFSRPKGQQCLTEWARPLLEAQQYNELADPRLGENYNEQEMGSMLYAASLCISPDPLLRPRMSQILRMLDGNGRIDRTSSSYSPGDNNSNLHNVSTNSTRFSIS